MQSLADYLNPTPDDLKDVILRLAQTGKEIAEILRRASFNNLLGSAQHINIQNEEQKKLDVLTNECFIRAFSTCPFVRALASEEMEHPLLNQNNKNARFLLLFDPLDGSSNIDINAPTGSIFSILPAPENKDDTDEKELLHAFLQPGKNQIAAGYFLYGSATEMALTTGSGTAIFSFNPDENAFFFKGNATIPKETAEFAINASNFRFWFPPIQQYVNELLEGKNGARQKDFNMRWVAAMVADVHRILNRGGVFLYPVDSKNQKSGGRLRLLYEANPMSFLIQEAGGYASTGTMPILDISPQKLHERVSVILGAENEVQRVEDLHRSV